MYSNIGLSFCETVPLTFQFKDVDKLIFFLSHQWSMDDSVLMYSSIPWTFLPIHGILCMNRSMDVSVRGSTIPGLERPSDTSTNSKIQIVMGTDFTYWSWHETWNNSSPGWAIFRETTKLYYGGWSPGFLLNSTNESTECPGFLKKTQSFQLQIGKSLSMNTASGVSA